MNKRDRMICKLSRIIETWPQDTILEYAQIMRENELKYLQIVRRRYSGVFSVNLPPKNFPAKFFKTYSKTSGMIIGPKEVLLSKDDILEYAYSETFSIERQYIIHHLDSDFNYCRKRDCSYSFSSGNCLWG